MKKKILLFSIISMLLGICLGACGNANTIQAISYDFKMEYIDSYGDIELWKDPETGVEYFVYSNRKGYGAGGICPRYIADGELYLDLERGEQND